MLKTLLLPIVIVAVIVSVIIALPSLVTHRQYESFLTDKALRHAALSRDMAPIPRDWKGMLKVVDNPDNPVTRKKAALGARLFFDPVLSKDRTVRCASCHKLTEGGDDNLPTAIGIHGQPNPHHLNSPTVLNAALAKRQFWDGRAKDVEEQAGGPVQAPFEMGMTPQEVERRLNTDTSYRRAFADVFGEGNITFLQVRKAIGAYERTLLTRGAFDRFLEGEDDALTPAAKRGLALFIVKGCKGCHTGMSVGGQSMQRFPLRRYFSEYVGLLFAPDITLRESPFPFPNTGGFLGRDDTLKFRVPILRNITRTAPYFHNGSVEKLEEAVRIMSKYQLGDEFTPQQIDDVVAFLRSLEGEVVAY